MGNTYLIGIYLVILINTSNNETIECNGSDCDCLSTASPGTKCILECNKVDICKGQTLTCRDGDPCEIHCNQTASCSSSYIDGYMASDVTIICSAEDACKDNVEISCGNGQCILQCDGDQSCRNWGYINVNRSQSFRCIGDCPNNIHPSFYHHSELTATSLPTDGHTNTSYTQSVSSHVNTISSTFVPSTDKTASEWDSGSIPTINGIDVDPILYVTFLLIIVVFYVCCILCGWVYFHSRNTKKLMEKQIKKMESKSKSCSFHKHSSCSVHQLNLPVTPSNKSHASIQYANSNSFQPQLDLNNSNAHSEYLSNDENINILSSSNARSLVINNQASAHSAGDRLPKQSASETSIERSSSSSSLTVDVVVNNENLRALSPNHTDISDMFVHIPDGPDTASKPLKIDIVKSNKIWIPPAPSKVKRSKSRRSELTDGKTASLSMIEPKKSRSLPPPPPRINNISNSNSTHKSFHHHIQYLRKQTDCNSVGDNLHKLSFVNYPSLPLSETNKSESMSLSQCDDIKLEPGAGPIMRDIAIGSGLAITTTRKYTSIPSVPTLPNASTSHSMDVPMHRSDHFASPKMTHLAPPSSADSEQNHIGNHAINAIITGNLHQLEEGEDSKTDTLECLDNGQRSNYKDNVINTKTKLATLKEENSHHMEEDNMSEIAKDINLILHAVRTDEGMMNGLDLDPDINDVDGKDIFGKIGTSASTKY